MIIFFQKFLFLVGDLLDFDKYVRNHEDTILISKMFQSRKNLLKQEVY